MKEREKRVKWYWISEGSELFQENISWYSFREFLAGFQVKRSMPPREHNGLDPSSSGFDQSFEISAILRNSRLVQRYGLTLSFAVSFIFRSFSSYSIYFFVGLFSRMFFLSSNFLSMVTLLLVLFSRFFTLHEESLRHENLRLQRWKEFRFHREYRRWMAVGKSRCSSMGETLG